jgi:hypothetical protein
MLRSFPRRRLALTGLLGLGAVLVVLGLRPQARTSDKAAAPDEAAVERARATVRMLDDVYKGYVVHITDTYVKAQERTPAAKVTKKVFKHMEDKGWHAGRLVDATGHPINPENAPRNDFEKRAVEQMKKGKPYFDEVGVKDGKPVLRAATVVPVVMKQCINCHPGYKEGDLLGTIVYELPIK